jgi:hypothetical protein
MNKRLLRTLSLALLAASAGCAPAAFVVLAPDYSAAQVKRVALVGFDDFPGTPGSGEVAASTFENYLIWGGYGLIERQQVQQIMQEQQLSLTGALDQATIHSIGKLLGVDALAFGTLSDYSNTREHTVMVDVPQEQTEPVYSQVVTSQRAGDSRVTNVQNVVSGYTSSETDQVVPETETVPAHVGMSVRLVDVQTGEILWSGSASSDGVDLTSASQSCSAAIMQAVVKQLKKAAPKAP